MADSPCPSPCPSDPSPPSRTSSIAPDPPSRTSSIAPMSPPASPAPAPAPTSSASCRKGIDVQYLVDQTLWAPLPPPRSSSLFNEKVDLPSDEPPPPYRSLPRHCALPVCTEDLLPSPTSLPSSTRTPTHPPPTPTPSPSHPSTPAPRTHQQQQKEVQAKAKIHAIEDQTLWGGTPPPRTKKHTDKPHRPPGALIKALKKLDLDLEDRPAPAQLEHAYYCFHNHTQCPRNGPCLNPPPSVGSLGRRREVVARERR
ncbi:uncharacterized protein EV422DRAFT_509670 [Fimicolochytrium jonesii]|uniref:uncharacterized protein n=1 Tax=Fimicolochytrium jonesii TaxID=1396493 RepID=UPI0022FE2278|nr:uncharacterized protein EV422DRAFT_509670 [Fimicolochytrium jonesii]KAI8816629.1 hypothetical protein EV422DRAFT_509670 [Fimicolochytrium jonesii]